MSEIQGRVNEARNELLQTEIQEQARAKLHDDTRNARARGLITEEELATLPEEIPLQSRQYFDSAHKYRDHERDYLRRKHGYRVGMEELLRSKYDQIPVMTKDELDESIKELTPAQGQALLDSVHRPANLAVSQEYPDLTWGPGISSKYKDQLYDQFPMPGSRAAAAKAWIANFHEEIKSRGFDLPDEAATQRFYDILVRDKPLAWGLDRSRIEEALAEIDEPYATPSDREDNFVLKEESRRAAIDQGEKLRQRLQSLASESNEDETTKLQARQDLAAIPDNMAFLRDENAEAPGRMNLRQYELLNELASKHLLDARDPDADLFFRPEFKRRVREEGEPKRTPPEDLIDVERWEEEDFLRQYGTRPDADRRLKQLQQKGLSPRPLPTQFPYYQPVVRADEVTALEPFATQDFSQTVMTAPDYQVAEPEIQKGLAYQSSILEVPEQMDTTFIGRAARQRHTSEGLTDRAKEIERLRKNIVLRTKFSGQFHDIEKQLRDTILSGVPERLEEANKARQMAREQVEEQLERLKSRGELQQSFYDRLTELEKTDPESLLDAERLRETRTGLQSAIQAVPEEGATETQQALRQSFQERLGGLEDAIDTETYQERKTALESAIGAIPAQQDVKTRGHLQHRLRNLQDVHLKLPVDPQEYLQTGQVRVVEGRDEEKTLEGDEYFVPGTEGKFAGLMMKEDEYQQLWDTDHEEEPLYGRGLGLSMEQRELRDAVDQLQAAVYSADPRNPHQVERLSKARDEILDSPAALDLPPEQYEQLTERLDALHQMAESGDLGPGVYIVAEKQPEAPETITETEAAEKGLTPVTEAEAGPLSGTAISVKKTAESSSFDIEDPDSFEDELMQLSQAMKLAPITLIGTDRPKPDVRENYL